MGNPRNMRGTKEEIGKKKGQESRAEPRREAEEQGRNKGNNEGTRDGKLGRNIRGIVDQGTRRSTGTLYLTLSPA